jgi:large subunit ribosomal protein L15
MKLHDIKPAKGSSRPKMRKGLGIAAGKGKTAGRGSKGQSSRSGGVKKAWFEGGQLSLMRRLPFARGQDFSNPYKIVYQPVNVGVLAGKFVAGSEVTPIELAKAGLIDKADKVAILGSGEITHALKITAHKISKSAQEKIEKAGGSVTKLDVPRGGYRVR